MTLFCNFLCIGAAHWDVVARAAIDIYPGDDLPGRVVDQPGGVALNIALALASEGARPVLLAAIGRDIAGERLIRMAESGGVDCHYVTRTGAATDRFVAIEGPDGSLFSAVADCRALEFNCEALTDPLADGRLASDDQPWSGAVVIDGNMSEEILVAISQLHALRSARRVFCPASPAKAMRLRRILQNPGNCFYLNLQEAEAICMTTFSSAAEAVREMLAAGAEQVLVTNGPHMLATGTRNHVTEVMPPEVGSTSMIGAGDRFLAAHLMALSRGIDSGEALAVASQAAIRPPSAIATTG